MSGDSSPRQYVLFRTAVPGILPVTRLPFAGFCRGWVVRSLSLHTKLYLERAKGPLVKST